tara:strand:- start:92267 stop:92827 length:561 start_codon:yes stop_codon:yes gene_type:complete
MTAKKTRPDSFQPTINAIAKRQPVIDELIHVIRQEMQLLKDHPLFSPPQQLVNWVEEHIRDHLVVRRRFQLFTKKIEGKDPQKLAEAEYLKIDEEFMEIMTMCARITDRWNMISEELNAWREDMDRMTDMFIEDSMEDSEDSAYKEYLSSSKYDDQDYDDYGDDEWSEGFDTEDFYADEDEDYNFE